MDIQSTLYFGTLAHLRGNPFEQEGMVEIVTDGALLISSQGKIIAAGQRAAVCGQTSSAEVIDYGDAWLLPGLIDGHCHFPQTYATGAYGHDLLDWLERSVFPAESRYSDRAYAVRAAEAFVSRLLACGTTTALVFGSQFLAANLALFDAAKAAGLRLIAGMTLMDRAGPEDLLQTTREVAAQVDTLLAHIGAEPLLHYAVTPRFALSCSPELMTFCAELLERHPHCYLQTHINESLGEIAKVARAFPADSDYLAIYERYALIGPRTVLAHNVHVSDDQLRRIAEANCAICHCPASNLYLGSGLFPLQRHVHSGIPVALGTDVGAGSRFSLWQSLAEAYKVQQLQGFALDAARLLYLGTLGAALALRLEDEVGNFFAGKSADFWVLDPSPNAYLVERLKHCESLEEQLFCLLQLATEAEVSASFVAGRRVHERRREVR